MEFISNSYGEMQNFHLVFMPVSMVVYTGGCSFKIRPTHRSIDDTLIQPKFVKFDNIRFYE